MNYGKIVAINGEQVTSDLLVENLTMFGQGFKGRPVGTIQVVKAYKKEFDNVEEDEFFSDSDDELYDGKIK